MEVVCLILGLKLASQPCLLAFWVLTSLHLLSFLLKMFFIILVIYYNKKVSCFRMIWQHFWRSLKENAEDGDKDVYRLPSEQQFEIRQLTHEMTIALKIHKHQYEELKHMLELVTSKLNNEEN